MGRNPIANQQARDERREKILRHAVEFFAKKGLAATRIADIAAAAGISQGLVYHYFLSKEALYTVLIEEAFAKMNGACRMLEALPISPREKILRAVTELLAGLETRRHAGYFYLLIAQASVSESIPEEAKGIILRERGIPYAVLTRIFAAGQAEGVFKPGDAETLALLFWTTINGLSIHQAVHGKRMFAGASEVMLRMFLTD